MEFQKQKRVCLNRALIDEENFCYFKTIAEKNGDICVDKCFILRFLNSDFTKVYCNCSFDRSEIWLWNFSQRYDTEKREWPAMFRKINPSFQRSGIVRQKMELKMITSINLPENCWFKSSWFVCRRRNRCQSPISWIQWLDAPTSTFHHESMGEHRAKQHNFSPLMGASKNQPSKIIPSNKTIFQSFKCLHSVKLEGKEKQDLLKWPEGIFKSNQQACWLAVFSKIPAHESYTAGQSKK